MPLGEGNGIHIKRDFLLERGELEVAASGSRSSGHHLSEGMQKRERRWNSEVQALKPVHRKHWDGCIFNTSVQPRSEDSKLRS